PPALHRHRDAFSQAERRARDRRALRADVRLTVYAAARTRAQRRAGGRRKAPPVPTGTGGACASRDRCCYGMSVAVPGRVRRPRPGRPATAFTEPDVVGATQKNAPSVPFDTPPTKGSGLPCTSSELPLVPLSV